MNEDPIVAEIRKFREEHAARYDQDLKRIVAALQEFEAASGRKVVHRNPRILAKPAAAN